MRERKTGLRRKWEISFLLKSINEQISPSLPFYFRGTAGIKIKIYIVRSKAGKLGLIIKNLLKLMKFMRANKFFKNYRVSSPCCEKRNYWKKFMFNFFFIQRATVSAPTARSLLPSFILVKLMLCLALTPYWMWHAKILWKIGFFVAHSLSCVLQWLIWWQRGEKEVGERKKSEKNKL